MQHPRIRAFEHPARRRRQCDAARRAARASRADCATRATIAARTASKDSERKAGAAGLGGELASLRSAQLRSWRIASELLHNIGAGIIKAGIIGAVIRAGIIGAGLGAGIGAGIILESELPHSRHRS